MARVSIRERLIEAAAPAIHANDPAYSPPYWSDCSEDMKVWYRAQASQALDAFLDVLTENASEWWVESASGRAVDCRVEHWTHEPEDLIALLRDSE